LRKSPAASFLSAVAASTVNDVVFASFANSGLERSEEEAAAFGLLIAKN
jgi:hypothetical protein